MTGQSWQIEDGTVLENGPVLEGADVGRMLVEAPAVTRAALPGQFLMLRTWEGEPLLPRAMAPLRYDTSAGRFEIFYRVKGPGTVAMCEARAGVTAYVIGPLGTPVLDTFAGRTVALVGRGVGITPLLPLAHHIVATGGKVRTYLSARTRSYLFGREEFATLGPLTEHADDESSGGSLVTENIRSEGQIDIVYVCGSRRLTQAVAALVEESGSSGFVFLESKMGCGVGYCKGCPASASGGGYRLVCTDGPILPIHEVLLEAV